MSAVRKSLPGKRSVTLYISVIALISIFFIGFFFYYVPANRDGLNKYAFSILQSVSNNIRKTNWNNINVYATSALNKLNKRGDKDSIKFEKDSIRYAQEAIKQGIRFENKKCPADSGDIELKESPTNSIYVKSLKQGIKGKEFFYCYSVDTNDTKKSHHKDTLTLYIEARYILRDLLESRTNELFESFILLKVCNGKAYFVYNDNNLNIGQQIVPDSLLTSQGKLKVMVPGIHDLDIKGLSYKMLYTPFSLRNDQLVICGFIKSDVYASRLHLIPVKFIYPIIIAFLLLMIALPLIKFYIMGPAENLRLSDMFGFLIAVFVGSTLLTIVIIQVILIFDADIRAKNDIGKLSNQIDSSYCRELQQAFRQLQLIDVEIKRQSDSGRIHYNDAREATVSSFLRGYLDTNKKSKGFKDSLYYNFDRVAWADTAGVQHLRAQLSKQAAVIFQQIDRRKYFAAFDKDKGEPYQLPGQPDSAMGLEPVYNWLGGDFTYVMSKRSIVDSMHIVTLSTKLYSVIETITPPGYGFCIIDEEGNVQVHSDLNRSLNENFLDLAEPDLPLREAIASRQNASFNEISFYGKRFSVNIKPIRQLPFYLVTFYDKGYIVPVNMRILIFSLILCFAFYTVLLLLWFFAIRKKHYANPLLYSPMDVLHWAIPKQHAAAYYRRCYKFIACYIGALLFVVFVLAKVTSLDSNYFVLNIVLFTPINIVCALAIFVDPPEISTLLVKKIKPASAAKWALACITIFAAIYIAVFANANIFQLFAFQFLFVIVMAGYRFKPIYFEKPGEGKNYIFSYALMVQLLVICLAVLPAGLFTWYSHNQEIIQGVKKQQLYIADKIQKRVNSVKANLKDWETDWLPENARDNALYKNGVYPIYPTIIEKETNSSNSLQGTDYKKSFEQFYFDIANRIGNNYYDPENYPALQDSSYDNNWFWHGEKNGQLGFSYRLYKNLQKKDTLNGIRITTQLPPRYVFLSASSKGLFLLILVISLLYGLFALIYYVSTNLFLLKYIDPSSPSPDSKGIESLISPYMSVPNIDLSTDNRLATLSGEHDDYGPNLGEDQAIAGEKQIITKAKELKIFYDSVWKSCTDEQKYLLHNFSKSGLMNFRATADIHSLFDKGILVQKNGRIQLFSKSFRAYILQLLPADQMEALAAKMGGHSTWQSFRKPFLLILMGAAAFIFFTQQEAWQRIMALITAFTTSLPLLLNVFSSSNAGKKN